MPVNVISAKYDFDKNNGSGCESGATFYRQFTWKNRDGSARDISDWTGIMQIRRNFDNELIAELNTSNNTLILNSSGEIYLSMTASATADLPAGNFKYDLILTDDSSNQDKYKLIEGKFVVYPLVSS